MESYREYVQGVMKRTGMSWDQSLASVSIIVKMIASQLTRDDFIVFKTNVVPELRQLVMETRPNLIADWRQALELIAATLEISHDGAKRRSVAVLEELRAGVAIWPPTHDVVFIEIIDRQLAQLEPIFTQSNVQSSVA